MREVVLRDFFLGLATPAELARDVRGSTKKVGAISFVTQIEDMEGQFSVTREMLVALCDAVLSTRLAAQELSTIGFALAASESFLWDTEDIVDDVIHDWSCPEINYPLTLENVHRFRQWLLYPESRPQRRAIRQRAGPEKLISVSKKKSIRRPREGD